MRVTSERYDRSYCIAVLDVDHFKAFNDLYGHLAGDGALRAVAATLADQARIADRVYRFGGEEFLVLLPAQSAIGGAVALERLRRSIESLALVHAGAEGGKLTVSIGLTGSAPGERPGTTEQMIALADLALYEAKKLGRNRLVVADLSTGSVLLLVPAQDLSPGPQAA